MKAIYNAVTGLDLAPVNTEDASMLDRIARQAVESRRYRLSTKQTPGLGYDDRLTERLGVSRNTVFKLIAQGRLHPTPIDGKIIISERAIRRFEDGIFSMMEAATEVSHALAA